MQRQGMKADVSWDRSAALYADLYASLVRRQERPHDRHDRRDHALRRPEAGHLGPAQEGAALPAAELRRELHPVDLRQPRGLRGQDAGDRRRRPLLQPRGHPDRAQDGRRQRLRPGAGRPGRPALDARRQPRHPQAQRLRRHHPLGQPQSRRPDRGLRHQVQHRQRRPGAREDHRGDLRPHQGDRQLPHPRRARPRPRPHRQRRRSAR